MKFFIILLSLAISISSKAQEATVPEQTPAAVQTPDFKPTHGLGVFAGASYTDLNTDDNASIDPTIGYRLGVITDSTLTEKISLRYGFSYTIREFSSTSGSTETTFKFNYVDIPVAVRYQITDMFGVFLGSVLAINVNNRTETNGVEGKVEPLKNLYPLAQIGANLTFNSFGVEVFYETGFTGIIRRAPTTDYSNFGVNFIYWL